MGKKQDIDEIKRGQINALMKVGSHSHAEIAKIVGVSRSFVSKYVKKVENGEPTTSNRKGRCGRKKVTSERDNNILVRKCRANRTLTSRQLKIEMESHNVKISERTVRRRLLNAGLAARRPRKKQFLNKRAVKQRRIWANRFCKWRTNEWKKVIFSDETMIYLTPPAPRTVRRLRGEEYNPLCVSQQITQPVRVMVWSAISTKGLFDMVIIKGKLNAKRYQKILQ